MLYKTLASADDTQSFCVADVYPSVFNGDNNVFILSSDLSFLSSFISIKWLPRRAQISFFSTVMALVADEAWAEVLVKSILVDFSENVFPFMFFRFLGQT